MHPSEKFRDVEEKTSDALALLSKIMNQFDAMSREGSNDKREADHNLAELGRAILDNIEHVKRKLDDLERSYGFPVDPQMRASFETWEADVLRILASRKPNPL
jgi:hypothetical protein